MAARTFAQRDSSIPVTFVSAASGRFGSFEPGAGAIVAEPSREVWAVIFMGRFPGPCGPIPVTPATAPGQDCTASSIREIVDARTLTFIMADEPAL
jgi:hypothetical protein